MNAQITVHLERTSSSQVELSCSACQFACTVSSTDDVEAIAKDLAKLHVRSAHKITCKLDTTIRPTLFPGIAAKKEKPA